MIPESCNDFHIFELRIGVQFWTFSISKILRSYYITALNSFLLLNFNIITRVGFGMEFLGIPNPVSRSRGFGIRIFHFELNWKIPKISKSRGSGFENPEKISSEKSLGSGSGFENPENSRENPKKSRMKM